jgi:hypothetical protein
MTRVTTSRTLQRQTLPVPTMCVTECWLLAGMAAVVQLVNATKQVAAAVVLTGAVPSSVDAWAMDGPMANKHMTAAADRRTVERSRLAKVVSVGAVLACC